MKSRCRSQTHSSPEMSPDAPPLRTIDPRDPQTAARELASLLGPTALQARFAESAADALPPIGPGLLSFAQITGGFTSYDHSEPQCRGIRTHACRRQPAPKPESSTPAAGLSDGISPEDRDSGTPSV